MTSRVTPAALRRQRLAQIDRTQTDLLRQIDRVYLGLINQIEQAYYDRLQPGSSTKARIALDLEYDRQSMLADAERRRQITLTYSEHARQSALTEAEYTLSKVPRKRVSHAKTPPKRVSHAKTASSFWKHFARDGRAVAPWDIQIGPGLDYEQDAGADDDSFFAEGEYSYEDFDTDWGVYESEDTGYPDENT